jgi:hypothetical protein
MPLNLEYSGNTFVVSARLKSPITEEILKLVKNDFEFKIKYNISLIINDRYTFRKETVNTLTFTNRFRVNDKEVEEDRIQEAMGNIKVSFSDFHFDENDHILIFIKATIEPDEQFAKATGLNTRILWNHYVPRIQVPYIYKNRQFVEIEE